MAQTTASGSYHVANLLEKMTSSDKDFRFMATNDLIGELQRDSIKLDDESERKVVRQVLKLLEDKNSEVQNLAVKCLSPLTQKCKDLQVESILDTLCNGMLSEKEQLRDTSSIALKGVVVDLPSTNVALAITVSRKVLARLVQVVTRGDLQGVQMEALDILSELLQRFGNLAVVNQPAQLEAVLHALLPLLAAPSSAVRKRAIVTLGSLVTSAPQPILAELCEHLFSELSRVDEHSVPRSSSGRGVAAPSNVRTIVQCVGVVARCAAYRFGEFLPRFFARIAAFAKPKSAADDDELIEFSLQTIEQFVRKCPKECAPFVDEIVSICLAAIEHDPNYSYDEDESVMQTDAADMDEDGEDEEEADEYSDADDVSWKIRRAATKCIDALMATRIDLLGDAYASISPKLIARFKEREENVRLDLLAAYCTLLKQTRIAVAASGAASQHRRTQPTAADAISRSAVIDSLRQQIATLLKHVSRLLRSKSVRTKQGCFQLLQELVTCLPAGSDILPAGELKPLVELVVASALTLDKGRSAASNSALRIDALVFLRLLVTTHSTASAASLFDTLTQPVLAALNDSFYKIVSEALLLTTHLVRAYRNPALAKAGDSASYSVKSVEALFDAVLVRLKQTDIDQEVKERAIACIAQFAFSFGDALRGGDRLPTCLSLLVDRLRNEITRLHAVRALHLVAQSPIDLREDLRPIANAIVPLHASFVRKQQRALKLASLAALDNLLTRYGDLVSADCLNEVIRELPALISESDLHVSQLVLCVSASIVRQARGDALLLTKTVWPAVLSIVQSPLLQGGALAALLEFMRSLGEKTRVGTLKFDELLSSLTQPLVAAAQASPPQAVATQRGVPAQPAQPTGFHKQAFVSVAKCVAALVSAHDDKLKPTVQAFLTQLSSAPADAVSTRLVALFALGEIGKLRDVHAAFGNVFNIVLEQFTSPNDDVKMAAAFALGGIAVGCLRESIPFVMNEMQTQPKRQYLLLHSLKEVISFQSQQLAPACILLPQPQTPAPSPAPGTLPAGPFAVAKDDARLLSPYLDSIWQVLIQHAENAEEGTRNVAAECLGKLTLLEPARLLPRLRALLRELAAKTGAARQPREVHLKCSVVNAVKYTLTTDAANAVGVADTLDELLRDSLHEFLECIKDDDLAIRRTALIVLNSAAHSKAWLIRDRLRDKILAPLYAETNVRKELIREVEMGPFRHTVDDGLEVRKAAFECMFTLLASCFDLLDLHEFVAHLELGLRDQYDIKLLAHLIVTRLCVVAPATVAQRVDRLTEPLKQTLLAKTKPNSVKQEQDKLDELKRSALRVLMQLLAVPDVDKHAQVLDLLTLVRSTADLQTLFDAVQKEAQSAALHASAAIDRPTASGSHVPMDTS